MASTVYLNEVQKCVDIKLGTKHYWTQIVKALLAAWPQSGVDIPTVWRWLGHSDGETLEIKTYGVFGVEMSENGENLIKAPKPVPLSRRAGRKRGRPEEPRMPANKS